ncbi:HA1F protein, partial [Pomatostomus ruficeps]|nr:HA1F protein [Pomatostomus ruficeps]
VLHSLRYLQVAVSEPSLGLPQYQAVAFVDGIPFARYDSERGWMELQTLWVGAGAKPGCWDTETWINERYQHTDSIKLRRLQVWLNPTHPPGLHTMQWECSCDLLSDGSVRGSCRDGYDIRDFISSQLGSRNFVAADNIAQIIKRHWEHEGIMAEEWTNYLEDACVEVLQKHVRYGREALEHKEAPHVHVSGKVEYGILTLSCHAYRFYPSTIGISRMKGDGIQDQETQWGGIIHNSDGTFHTWARIEALPEEREQYQCWVEHPGMLESGIFAWELESGQNLILVVTVSIIAAIIILIGFGFGVWKLQSGNTQDEG